LPRNQLIHLAGVYDRNNEARFYVNGQLQSRVPAKGIHRPSGANFSLGANPPTPGHAFDEFFQGRICEARVSKIPRYDGDFTPARRFVSDGDTIALYHFDEGQGNVIKDSSGNGHHGEIVAAKWVNADGSPIVSPPEGKTPPLATAPFDADQA